MSAPTPDIARLDVPLAQLSADLEFVRLKREAAEELKRLKVQAHQYDVSHLDADSKYTLPGCTHSSYLTGIPGGQP